jgi:acetyltransferase-like isoleucine patch superfamily enzyme
MNLWKRVLARWARRSGLARRLYRRAADGLTWAAFLKDSGELYSMGERCYISTGANITDPAYLHVGNNVRLSDCTILGHDGSVNMVNEAYGLTLDSVGPVTIHDNVFIGYGAIVCPNVSIGPNAIVGAGAVVVRDVKEGEVVFGAPAKAISRLDISVEALKARNAKWPWSDLIRRRGRAFDPALERELVRMRQAHFFGAQRDRPG